MKDGKKQFAVLPYEEYVALRELLADASDLIELRQAKAEEASAETISLSEAKRRLDLGESAVDSTSDKN